MNIWLDDERNPSDYVVGTWWWVTRAEDLIRFLSALEDMTGITLSLDHDLGDGVLTGYDVMLFIEDRVAEGWNPPTEIRIHTQNPVGRKNMEAARRSIYDLAERRNSG